MSITPSPASSPPVSTASRAMTPPWQPLRLEDAWKALPFAEVDKLPISYATDDESTKRTSAEATQFDSNDRRVRFGVDTVAEYSDVAAGEEDSLQSAPMDVDEPAVKVDAKSDKEASDRLIAPTSKPAKSPHPTTASGVPTPSASTVLTATKPRKKRTRPVSLTNPPLLDYMCRCNDCAARRAEFLQTIGRRTVRWDEWPWCMVGDGYGTWYEEEVTISEGDEEE